MAVKKSGKGCRKLGHEKMVVKVLVKKVEVRMDEKWQ